MPDFGLYNALSYQDNWDTKRHDAVMTMQALQSHRKDLENDLQVQQANEAQIADMIQTFSNLDILPEDQERVKKVESDARREIIRGVTSANGDLKRYMNTGGVTAMAKYKDSVLKSKEVQMAMMNKTNLGLYLKAASDGKYIKPVQMESYEIDEATGEEKVVPKMVSFEDQYKLFREGKIDQLIFTGAEDPVKVQMEDFSQLMKDPLHPYSPDNIVSVSNMYEKALSKGASHEQATDIAKRYQNMIQRGGDIWKWGGKDMMDLNLKLAQLEQDWAKIGLDKETIEFKKSQARAAAEANKYGNEWQTKLLQMGRDSEGNITPETAPIEPDMWKRGLIQPMLGITEGGNDAVGSVPQGPKWRLDPNRSYALADGTKISGKGFENMYVISQPSQYYSLGDKKYVILNCMTSDDDIVIDGISEGMNIHDLTSNATNNGWSYVSEVWSGMEGFYTGQLMVEITDYVNDPNTVAGINDVRTIQPGKSMYTASSMGDEDQQFYMYNNMRNSGMSPDQYIQGSIQANQRK